jgi:enamine deaminase RidA (YjgF/YER057c/UK114 family)
MNQRINISSGAKWEEAVGYSRAVRVGPLVEISGTTAMEGDTIVGENDAYRQTHYILEKAAKVLEQLGLSLEQVVRTRMYVTDISKWEQVGKAHGAFFKDIKPATSMVEVKALIDHRMLVEIELTAWAE